MLSGGLGLNPVMTRHWGGLTLTILITSCSILFSLPIGILLALCRRSSIFLIQKSSSVYIDVMRAVPLISVLFFGQLLIPLFLPVGLEIDRVWRAVIAFTFFVSAYIAEDIKGGLQSIPKNQIEAAKSLGLNKYQINICGNSPGAPPADVGGRYWYRFLHGRAPPPSNLSGIA